MRPSNPRLNRPGLMRRMFGPSQAEIWRRLAEQIGGQFEEGTWRRSSRVVVGVEHWTVTLDTFSVNTGETAQAYTRLRAPYVNADGFRFELFRSSIFSGLRSLVGLQDVPIGEAAFDKAFVVKAGDEGRVRTLLADADLRARMLAQPSLHLQVIDDEGWFGGTFPDGVDELRCTVPGVVRDVDRLRDLYDLFARLLHRLCAIGSAYEDDPGLML